MFLTALAVSLALGAGLLAAASYSEGTLIALRTAAQGIGWLLVLAAVVGLTGRRRAGFGKLGAATVAFLSGLAVLYVAYFEWGQVPDAPIRHAAAEILPARELVYKAPLASIASPQAAADPCASLTGVDSLQCRRCAEKLGVAWIVCQESARLEYCQGRQDDEATCPSAIPFSPPG